MKDCVVTPGELAVCLSGIRLSEPISASEMASDALRVVGQLNSTLNVVKAK